MMATQSGRRLLCPALACVLLFCGIRIASAQPTQVSAGNYLRTSWTQFDGLSIGEVTAIAQDHDGYLWLGTAVGPIRFDGVRFERWDTQLRSLPDRDVSVLKVARDGALWVGFGSGGVSRITAREVRTYDWRQGMLQGPVRSLVEDRDGVIWVGGAFGLARLKAGEWTQLGTANGIPANTATSAMLEDRNGHLWVTTSRGLLRKASDEQFELVEPSERPLALVEHPDDGSVWGPDAQGRLTQLGSPRSSQRPSAVRQRVTTLFHDRRGFLWMAGDRGFLACIESPRWSDEPVAVWPESSPGELADAVQAIFEDREGNIWLGTTTGLSRLSVRSMTDVAIHPVFEASGARVMTVAPSGTVWAGTRAGVVRFEKGQATRYGNVQGLPGEVISALHVDVSGTVWAATENGVAQLSGEAFVPVPGLSGLKRVIAMASNQEGLWLCDFTGLYQWKEQTLKPIRGPRRPPEASATAVHADRIGRVWVGFVTGGFSILQNGVLTDYSNDQGVPDAIVSGFHQSANGDTWITTTSGLARFHGGRIAAITAGFPDMTFTSVTEDDDGYFWLGTRLGLIRVALRELDKAIEDPAHRLDFRFWDAQDGFSAAVWVGGPRFARMADGTIWFVTRDGVSVVRPASLAELPMPPPVRVERVIIDERPQSPSDNLRLPASTRRLQLDFTSLTFAPSTKLRFRYQMLGLDPDWIEAGGQRRAFYTNLAPGTYRFRVAARNLGGLWTEPTEWAFTIRAPFYRTYWFYALAATGVTGGLWLVWHARVSRIRRRFAAVIEERARVGREIHDTLLQGMVGVALQLGAVAEQLERGNGSVKGPIHHALDTLERSIRETRSSIWDLRSPQLDARGLPGALREAGNELVAGTHLRFKLLVEGSPRGLGTIEQQLLRIAREAISNAIRHANASLVTVTLVYADDGVTLRVSDDGHGFRADDVRSDTKWGLRIMRERAAQAGAKFTVESGASGTDIVTTVHARERVFGG